MTTKSRKAYQEYLKSHHWNELRTEVLVRDSYRCTGCRAGNTILQVHHKLYRDTWEQTIPSDLITLCVRCHRKEHKGWVGPPSKKAHKKPKKGRKIKHQHRQSRKQLLPKTGWEGRIFHGSIESGDHRFKMSRIPNGIRPEKL
jgi:5-methylcytosine-specific restriction endonuclease McrA